MKFARATQSCILTLVSFMPPSLDQAICLLNRSRADPTRILAPVFIDGALRRYPSPSPFGTPTIRPLKSPGYFHKPGNTLVPVKMTFWQRGEFV